MSKYNFYELKGKKLPEDINKPVIDMLENKLKCKEAADFIRKFQNNKNCGSVQIFDKKQPKYIKVTANYGMVEGFDLVETVENDRFVITASKHIKNDNLDMKKSTKDKV